MCIIAVKPLGIDMFDDQTIKNMFQRNHDGAGIMWAENGSVCIKKGFMNVDSFLEFVHARNDWKDIPAVAHFRIGTAGPNDEMNCHPYPIRMKNAIECECELAMVHNGILSGYNPPLGSTLNDTQVFINTVINKLPKKFLKNEAIVKLIESAIGTSKLTFLDKDGNITCLGHFIDKDGYKFSNDSYKGYAYSWSYPRVDSTSSINWEKNKNEEKATKAGSKKKTPELATESVLFPNLTFWCDDYFDEDPEYTCLISKKNVGKVEKDLQAVGIQWSNEEYQTKDGLYWLEKDYTTLGDAMLHLYPNIG